MKRSMSIHAFRMLLNAYAIEFLTVNGRSMSQYKKCARRLELIENKLFDVLFEANRRFEK